MNDKPRRSGRHRLKWIGGGVIATAGLFAAAIVPNAAGVTPGSGPAGAGFYLTVADTQYILKNINIGLAHSAKATNNCASLQLSCIAPSTNPLGSGANDIATPLLPDGIRSINGANNNLTNGFTPWNGIDNLPPVNFIGLPRPLWGAADQTFTEMAGVSWRPAETTDPDLFSPAAAGTAVNYSDRTGSLQDPEPRIISNLISDQSSANPAAVRAATLANSGADLGDGSKNIANTAPNFGVAAPYNGNLALFGQFFDHGLDLVGKGQNVIRIDLQLDDPLYCVLGTGTSGAPNFTPLANPPAAHTPGNTTSGTWGVNCGDRIFLSRTNLDASFHAKNTTTPWIDQNQSYGSDPSKNIFLREYTCRGLTPQTVSTPCTPANPPVATGHLQDGAIRYNNSNWGEIKTQASVKLGINLANYDVDDVPAIASDEYGNFIAGPNGFPMLVRADKTTLAEGNPATPVNTIDMTSLPRPAAVVNLSARTGHAFLDDIRTGAKTGRAAVGGGTCTNLVACVDNASPVLDAHFVHGDGRGNENIGLTAIHTIFHAEHNRLVEDLKTVITNSANPTYIAQWKVGGVAANDWDGNKLFLAAQFVNAMEYQHLVFDQFIRLIEPDVAPTAGYNPTVNPDITDLFAHAVYRFGHSMLSDTIQRNRPANNATGGGTGASCNVSLLTGFTNPQLYNTGCSGSLPGAAMDGTDAAGAVLRGMTLQRGQAIDPYVINTLKNNLLGLPLDLAALNLARGRDTGVAPLNAVRAAIQVQSNNPGMAPYANWDAFRLALNNDADLVNFVAAYAPGAKALNTLVAKRAFATAAIADANFMASNAGLDDIDLWAGGLAERSVNQAGGSMLGPTFSYIFRTQMEKLQDPDRFYYLNRLPGTNLITQLETNSFSEMVQRNTGANNQPLNQFLQNAVLLDMQNPAIGPPDTRCGAPNDCTLTAAGAITNGRTRWLYREAPAPGPLAIPLDVVITGSTLADYQVGGLGNDALKGLAGSDRLDGADGNDTLFGGDGNDLFTDALGGNLLNGAAGDDVFLSGGTDTMLGNIGDDFFATSNNAVGVEAGPGKDLVAAGTGDDGLNGNDQEDWIDASGGADIVSGDNVPPFGVDLDNPGADVLDGGSGTDLLNGDGAVDVFNTASDLEADTMAGGLGFDFITYDDALAGVHTDLGLVAAPVNAIRNFDTFTDVEGAAGSPFADTIMGDDRTTLVNGPGTTLAGAPISDALEIADFSKFRNLSSVLSSLTSFSTGNVLLGGLGSDSIEGRGGDDRIDGDSSMNVRISVPTPTVCTGSQVAPNAAVTGAFVTDPANAANILVKTPRQLQNVIAANADNLALGARGCNTTTASTSFARTVVSSNGNPGDVDTAVFRGPKAAYNVTAVGNTMVVEDVRFPSASTDGTDTLTGIEQLQFSDGTVAAAPFANVLPRGFGAPPGAGGGAGPAGAASGNTVQTVVVRGADGKAALAGSTVKRNGRKIVITVNADTSNGKVSWKATLKNTGSKKVMTTSGTIRPGSTKQVKSVTVPKDWVAKKHVTTVTLSLGSVSNPFKVK